MALMDVVHLDAVLAELTRKKFGEVLSKCQTPTHPPCEHPPRAHTSVNACRSAFPGPNAVVEVSLQGVVHTGGW